MYSLHATANLFTSSEVELMETVKALKSSQLVLDVFLLLRKLN